MVIGPYESDCGSGDRDAGSSSRGEAGHRTRRFDSALWYRQQDRGCGGSKAVIASRQWGRRRSYLIGAAVSGLHAVVSLVAWSGLPGNVAPGATGNGWTPKA